VTSSGAVGSPATTRYLPLSDGTGTSGCPCWKRRRRSHAPLSPNRGRFVDAAIAAGTGQVASEPADALALRCAVAQTHRVRGGALLSTVNSNSPHDLRSRALDAHFRPSPAPAVRSNRRVSKIITRDRLIGRVGIRLLTLCRPQLTTCSVRQINRAAIPDHPGRDVPSVTHPAGGSIRNRHEQMPPDLEMGRPKWANSITKTAITSAEWAPVACSAGVVSSATSSLSAQEAANQRARNWLNANVVAAIPYPFHRAAYSNDCLFTELAGLEIV
jgi:hypothetical protein